MDRQDMTPLRALAECYDLWASGAWDDRNAIDDLAETMDHVQRLLTEWGVEWTRTKH
jgi:succinate dehydrogenase/fumarate reductase flavoprotein subunit